MQAGLRHRPHIVIVGGGAGGVELAARLGRRLGRRGRARITLIDRNAAHFWKPHLHEIASGSLNLAVHELSYMALGFWNGFTDRIGEVIGIDRARQVVQVAPHLDEHGRAVTPPREFAYDLLVLAVGGCVNDFGVPGVRRHALTLETPGDGDRFHQALINACIRAHAQPSPLRAEQLKVAVVGAGATGVELAAELPQTVGDLIRYGLDGIDPARLCVYLLEAGPRILPALPAELSAGIAQHLKDLRVRVHTEVRVVEVRPDGVLLDDGDFLPAEIVVWAAGVRGPDVLATLDGLEVNAANKLVVTPELRTTRDPAVFAIGDCAACPDGHGGLAPARAQAAHQQARHLTENIIRYLEGQPLRPWRYDDFGTLVSLGRKSGAGTVVAAGRVHGLWGWLPRIMYLLLYQLHLCLLLGPMRTAVNWLAGSLLARARPRVKLH